MLRVEEHRCDVNMFSCPLGHCISAVALTVSINQSINQSLFQAQGPYDTQTHTTE